MMGHEFIDKKYPNQGIKKSAKNIIYSTFIYLPFCILVIILLRLINNTDIPLGNMLTYSFMLALLYGISFGGDPVIKHISLRLILWKNRSIPWNYAHFLTYTDDRKLIHQVGGRFTFIHALLQEHFAQME